MKIILLWYQIKWTKWVEVLQINHLDLVYIFHTSDQVSSISASAQNASIFYVEFISVEKISWEDWKGRDAIILAFKQEKNAIFSLSH